MEELLQPLVALGGFGYFNYWLSIRLSDMDLGGESDKKYLIALMTSLDYTFYLIVSNYIEGVVKRILVAMLLAVIFSLAFPFLIKLLYWVINRLRSVGNQPEMVPLSVKDDMFNDDKDRCFIFDFEGNLISSGAMGMLSGKNEEFSMKLYPYFASHEEHSIRNEEALYQFLEQKNLEARVYLNFEKKIKIIYF
ncbi:hypothetical protein K6V39_07680 [Streptococcus suis]|uniref:Uncharacterized protein n=1 Tax=Streptococcus suis TaxID=1307 RepID=A0A0M9FEC6_STRSU|nr:MULTISPECIES: hypothetical protein [Streptococcus]AZR97728.1 hypothetical protein A7J10_07730 [Streptococcus suis]KPA63466.1 hypothetical protein XK27_11800 [Streptococcus suis]MBY4962463.1 hypothetical protein [Streptococcus suis]MBY4968798.1 hypothetical protein [Streptococcus suis]MBY4979915.1 hypothetical protein [Streptococcus suis]